MKKTLILFLLTTMFAGNTTLIQAQNTYQIENGNITLSDNIRETELQTIKKVLSRFVDEGNYNAKYFYSGKDHLYLDVQTPVIAKGEFSEMTAILRIDARRVFDGIRLIYTCNRIDVFFPSTEIHHTYNPADNYPVRFPFNQKKTMIKQEDVQNVFDEIVKTMHAVSKRLAMEIKEYQ